MYTLNHTKLFAFVSRENTKEKDKTEGTAEETEEREQAIPRGRKTANSQGRRKGRITRSMTNEAAAASAAAAAATEEPPPPLPPPPEPSEWAHWSAQAILLFGILFQCQGGAGGTSDTNNLEQGFQTHFHWEPHQLLSCLRRAECNFRTV